MPAPILAAGAVKKHFREFKVKTKSPRNFLRGIGASLPLLLARTLFRVTQTADALAKLRQRSHGQQGYNNQRKHRESHSEGECDAVESRAQIPKPRASIAGVVHTRTSLYLGLYQRTNLRHPFSQARAQVAKRAWPQYTLPDGMASTVPL